MNEFIKVFGGVSVNTALLTIMAIIFLWDKFRKFIDYFSGQQSDKEKTKEMYRKVQKISLDFDLLLTSQVEVYKVRLQELYIKAKQEYAEFGYVTIDTAESYDLLFELYEKMGGNGRYKTRHDEIFKLPRG